MSPAVFLQYVLPHRFLSRLAYWLARCQIRWLKNLLIRTVIKRFGVNMDEAAENDLNRFEHFNAFFTRSLKPGARTADPDGDSILCPADGRISQIGSIEAGRIFQAKGHSYSAAELLANDADAVPFENGSFANIYLSPRDYHRVHMPVAGRLIKTVHVPGRLFSVAPWAVADIPRLFARNERLVCHFETAFGPMVSVMVGAILVSGIETVWSGEEVPSYASCITVKDYSQQNIRLERFAEMARFNYGSTVILLFPSAAARLDALEHVSPVRLGQSLGKLI